MRSTQKILGLWLCLMLLATVKLVAQDRLALMAQIDAQSNDSLKMQPLLALAKAELNANSLDNAISYANESYILGRKYKATNVMAQSQRTLARAYALTQNTDEALRAYLRTEGYLQKLGNRFALADLYVEIGNKYQSIKADEKAIWYFDKAQNLLNSKDSPQEIREIGTLLADAYLRLEKHDAAIAQYKELLALYNATEQIPRLKCLQQLSIAHQNKGDYDQALDYGLQMLKEAKEAQVMESISAASNNLGVLYFRLNDYQKSTGAFKQAAMIDELAEKKTANLANIYTNIAICYQNTGQTDEATEYLLKAIDVRKALADKNALANLQNVLALVYFYGNDYYNAEVYSEQSITTAEVSGNKAILRDCYKTYSRILQDANQYEKAMAFYQKHLSLRDSLLVEKRLQEQELAQVQYEAEKTEKDAKLELADEEMKDLELKRLKLEADKRRQELDLLRSERELQQSRLHSQQQDMELSRKQHEAELKERDILKLEQEKRLQKADLQQKEQEKALHEAEIQTLKQKEAVQQVRIEKQDEQRKRAIYMSILGLVIFVLVLFGLLLTKKKNRALASQKKEIVLKNTHLAQQNEEILAQRDRLEVANIEIEKKNLDLEQKQEEIMAYNEEIRNQKEIIEKKNEAITDSIVYAKRIQSAMLPPASIIADSFPAHFILFRPRDIVSGDFYWMRQIDNKAIIAAADSTGHGVPGAFMSMLGMSFLNEIVAKDGLTQPSLILNRLRDQVKSSLRQTGKANESKDGMDIALLSIDLKTGLLQYAGAYNPLLIVRDGEIIHIKADKMPIGIYLREKESFSNHEIQLQTGDCIYIFSDGYVDQFGGERGDKFKTKRFKELLLHINGHPMPSQLRLLEKQLIDWMGTAHMQIDDVIVIGIRY